MSTWQGRPNIQLETGQGDLKSDACQQKSAPHPPGQCQSQSWSLQSTPISFWKLFNNIWPGNNISNLVKLGGSGCVDVGYREVVHKANLSEVTERLTGPSTYLPTAPLPLPLPPPSSAPSSHEPPLFRTTITIHHQLNLTHISFHLLGLKTCHTK